MALVHPGLRKNEWEGGGGRGVEEEQEGEEGEKVEAVQWPGRRPGRGEETKGGAADAHNLPRRAPLDKDL